jgi:hypothetical protein
MRLGAVAEAAPPEQPCAGAAGAADTLIVMADVRRSHGLCRQRRPRCPHRQRVRRVPLFATPQANRPVFGPRRASPPFSASSSAIPTERSTPSGWLPPPNTSQ